jgi:hypothetical protein
MTGELVNAFILRVDGHATAVVETLEAAQRDGQAYIETGHDVSVQTTSGRVVEWYFDSGLKAWVYTEHPRRRPNQ